MNESIFRQNYYVNNNNNDNQVNLNGITNGMVKAAIAATSLNRV